MVWDFVFSVVRFKWLARRDSYDRTFFSCIGGIKREIPGLFAAFIPLDPSADPTIDFGFGCCTPSLPVNSFPTPLILDAICNNFSRLPYLVGASQACPAAALLTICHNCTSVKNQLSSIDTPPLPTHFCCLHKFYAQFCVGTRSLIWHSV